MTVRIPAWLAVAGLSALMAAAMTVAACGSEGEDRPNVDVLEGGGGTGSVSGVEPPVTLGVDYTPTSDQAINLAIGLDLRDLRALMAPAGQGAAVDWAQVLALYESGKNQSQSGGSLRSLASLAGESNDTMIRDAINGTGHSTGLSDASRRQIVDKGIQAVMYELAVHDLTEARGIVDANGDGAAVLVDQAWAALAGEPDENGNKNNGVLATAARLEEDFSLLGKVAPPLEVGLADALAGVQGEDAELFESGADSAEAHLNAVFYLGTIRFTQVAERDARASDREAHLAEGWAYFQVIRPIVAAASPTAAETVETALTSPAADPFPATLTVDVLAALNEPAVLEALGIPEALQIQPPTP